MIRRSSANTPVSRACKSAYVLAAALCCTAWLTACDRHGGHAPSDPASPGGVMFATYCAACHGSDGRGADDRFPPLVGSTWVAGPDEPLIRIVLHGLAGPIEVGGRTYNTEMLGFGSIMTDEQVATLLTHVRLRFTHADRPVTDKTVARVRAATADRLTYWTVEELNELRPPKPAATDP